MISVFNQLFPVTAVATDVVDIRGLAPPLPGLDSDKTEYFQGDTVTLRWNCKRNPTTNLRIVSARVVAWISGKEIFRELFPGENINGTTSFTAPSSGFLDVRVSCIDEAGRGSGNDETFEVHNVQQTDFCSANPDHPNCKPPPLPFPLVEALLLTLAFIGVFLVLIVFAFLLNRFGVPPLFNLLISIALFVILAIVIVILGSSAIETIQIWQEAQI